MDTEREQHRKTAAAKRRHLYRLDNLATLERVRRLIAAADAEWVRPDAPDPPARSSDEQGGSACCLECDREISKHDLELDTTVLGPDKFCRWCARPSSEETRAAALEARAPKNAVTSVAERRWATVKIGDHVVFVDPLSQPRSALVTAVWGEQPAYMPVTREPGLNVVIVSDDAAREDSYGRQIERQTSVVHVTNQVAPGSYWCRPEEYDASRDRKLRGLE